MSNNSVNESAPKRKHAGGRPRTGSLEFRGTTWYGRVTVERDGEKVRDWVNLHTAYRNVAKRKLARILSGELAIERRDAPEETFKEVAARVVKSQKAVGTVSWKDRERRLELYAHPYLGHLPPSKIKAADVRAMLLAARDAGKAHDTLAHLKSDVSVVLGDLWQAEKLPENVCKRVKLPPTLKPVTERSSKERATLTDAELAIYLAWQHPGEQWQAAALERQVMAVIARCFGGVRTGDLHAATWEMFETEGGQFTYGWAPRRKTRHPQKLEMPELVRPILRDWWERAGRPTTGLLFPCRTGKRAGDSRKHSSHAEAFRRDLQRAFGIEKPTFEPRKLPAEGKSELVLVGWETAREFTPRERELFEETPTSLPVDWHSWRRAFSQALADAGVPATQAKLLAGHATEEAHDRYLRSSATMRRIPIEALPRLRADRIGGVSSTRSGQNSDVLVGHSSANQHNPRGIAVGVSGFEPPTTGTQSSPDRTARQESSEEPRGLLRLLAAGDGPQIAATDGSGQNSGQNYLAPALRAAALDAAIAAYLKTLADGIAATLAA